MEWLHIFIAILSSFRITILFTEDAIWSKVRKATPKIPWNCSLCMSVWSGIISTVSLVIYPWLNWPFAFSWLYLAAQNIRRTTKVENVEKLLNARMQALIVQREDVMNKGVMLHADLMLAQQEIKDLVEKVTKLEKTVADSVTPKSESEPKSE